MSSDLNLNLSSQGQVQIFTLMINQDLNSNLVNQELKEALDSCLHNSLLLFKISLQA